MLKRHEIQVLRRAGHTWQEVAALSGVSVRTVRRVAAEAAVTTVDNAAERARRQVGRPVKAEAYRDVVVQALTEDPDVAVRRVAAPRPAGGLHRRQKCAVCLGADAAGPHGDAVGAVRRPARRVFAARLWRSLVRYQDGTETKVHFFASRLKYSRWVEVTLVPDERVETLVRTLVDHLAAFGGIPLVAVFDRPKTVALKWGRDGVVTEWNPTFAGVALDLGIGVEVCWPYRPQEKGSVENLVGWVKGSFFKQRRFLDREDLERQLREWLTEANTVRPSRATGVPPAARLGEERARLRPLKVAPADLALRIPVSVGPTGVVIHDTHPYSMPPDAIGLPGTLYLYRDRVRIVAGRFSAEHVRQWQPGDGSILPEHRAERVAAVSGKRARRYLQRQHLLDLGPARLGVSHRAHASPAQHVDSRMSSGCTRCCRRTAMRPCARAFDRGLAEQAIGAEYIAHYLGALHAGPPFDAGRTGHRR